MLQLTNIPARGTAQTVKVAERPVLCGNCGGVFCDAGGAADCCLFPCAARPAVTLAEAHALVRELRSRAA